MNYRSPYSFLVVIFLGLFLVSCGYKKTPSGLEYRVIKNGSGDKVKDGDFVKIHFIRYFEDSLAFDTHSSGNPEMFVYKSDLGKGERYNLMEIIANVKKGDSIVIRLPYDSIFSGQINKPPFYKKGGYIKMYLSVVDIISQTQANKEMEERVQEKLQQDIQNAKKDSAVIKEFVLKNKLSGSFNKIGVFVNIIKEGKGDIIKKDTTIDIKYMGKLLDGTIFDSNIGGKPPKPLFKFKVGLGQVVQGLDYSVIDLKKGSIVRLIIPSSLAYGEQAMGDRIPANSVLDFYIEITQ